MIRKNKLLLGALTIGGILFVGCFLTFIYAFTVSEDSYAEYYGVKISSQKLIEKATSFKKNNPNYEIAKKDADGVGEYKKYAYYIYFYLPEEDKTLLCVIRSDEPNTSIITFRSVSDGNARFANWRTINSDKIGDEENTRLKKAFETEILSRLKLGKWYRKGFFYGIWHG